MLTILWHNAELAGYTDYLKTEWLARAVERRKITHLVTGPGSERYKARCNITVNGTIVECDYEPYVEFNNKHGMHLGVIHIQFADSTRQRVTQILWKDAGKKRFVSYSPTVAFVSDDPKELDALVVKSNQLSPERRHERLAAANRKPASTRVTSTAFLRNPDVVAEVLFRAHGVCERCKQPAPFKRATDGTPYLEVHHRIRLADGGDDTVENAVALCPNCHRKAHYG